MLDGHNDLAILIRFVYQNNLYNESFIETFENGGMFGQVDLPRLKDGKAGGAFWSAFTPCPPNSTDFSDSNYAECKLYCSIYSHFTVSIGLKERIDKALFEENPR